MSDCLSVQSNGSLQVNSGKLDKMHEPNLEDRLGFKPDGTNNFLCTVYNSRTKVRDIMFDGAMALHEFAPLLYDFVYKYIKNAKVYETYMLSVMTCDSETINIAILEGDRKEDIKKARVNEYIDKLFFTLDNVFGLFVLSGKNGNKNNIQGRKYRLHMTFSELENSYKIYNKLKPKIMELLKNNLENVVNDVDTEDSD